MNRRTFFTRLAAVVGVAAVAPKVLAEATPPVRVDRFLSHTGTAVTWGDITRAEKVWWRSREAVMLTDTKTYDKTSALHNLAYMNIL